MTQDILFTQQGQLGLITLNRPNALNALSLDMIKELQKHLLVWKNDDAIKAVVIYAVPGTAFCAGGDVRWLYQLGAQRIDEQMEFFWHEYRLNHFIHHLGKPYIALMDGITMGGGVGVSLHGSHPIASERFVFAMPETSIGFFPDIGSSHFLTQCPDTLGIYLGLSGNRLTAYEAKNAGLVRTIISSAQMPLIVEKLAQSDLSNNAFEQVDQCLATFTQEQDKPLAGINTIKECFSLNSVESILNALVNHSDPWAQELHKSLKLKSPFSLKLSLAQLQKAQGLSLADCLKMDFNLVRHFMSDHDFYEGVRALLIDKDKKPQWNPASLELVTETKIISYFEPSSERLEFIA
ncbi:enoyl-CoA hydratase/isomerase family protein [Legionella sp. km772]|uniref:enoyl-CoA hydratase/isomerase family protein n=1 Tax=Legionella sp. km772 TaxID=2498111 RepID=UPI000F8CF913|nr:enoyl-CoA hydratase/isomerase family protein [Legionella sp. km772]RUR13282.1 enoyl-CoA hydratase/isomerase family protein [Legionella sp. km772]